MLLIPVDSFVLIQFLFGEKYFVLAVVGPLVAPMRVDGYELKHQDIDSYIMYNKAAHLYGVLTI